MNNKDNPSKKPAPHATLKFPHITSTPMSFTTPERRYPATNLAIPSDEDVAEGRAFSEENMK